MNGHITGGGSVDVNANATNDAEAHTLVNGINLGGTRREVLMRRHHEQRARERERGPGRHKASPASRSNRWRTT